MENIHTHLSSDLFANIFASFTLQELLPLRLICRSWNRVIEQICSLRESLKLFTTFEDILHYRREYIDTNFGTELEYWKLKQAGHADDLLVGTSSVPTEFWSFLIRLFPNIQHLIVFCNADRSLVNLVHLLQYYKLKSLSICGSISAKSQIDLPHIYSNLNSQPNLKRLDLLAAGLFGSNLTPAQLAPTLFQLTRCSVTGSNDLFPGTFEYLSEHCASLSFVNISLDSLPEMYDALSTNPRLVSSVAHLKLMGNIPLPLLGFVCSNFRNLTKLGLYFGPKNTESSSSQILLHLSNLRNLAELHLFNFFYNKQNNPSLPSITTLTLVNCQLDNLNHFAVHFPNLEYFYINFGLSTLSSEPYSIFPKLKSFSYTSLREKSPFGRHQERFEAAAAEQMDIS